MWHPRVVPFFAWIVLMLVVWLAVSASLWLYVPLYAVQCLLVAGLLWRYRKQTPELNIKFHWLAVPTAVLVTVVWIALGWLMTGEFALRWQALWAGRPLGTFADLAAANPGATPGAFTMQTPHDFELMQQQWPAMFYVAVMLRLVGMAMIVPFFEELFTRSLLLRAFHRAKPTMVGLVQVLEDMPLVGDWLLETRASRRAAGKPFMWSLQLRTTPVGAITLFSVIASTLVFTMNHTLRDYAACVFTGVTWCLLVWWTNRGDRKQGLGPVIWSHGLCNAMLLAYCVWTGDWQFL